jgi:hypothetical protein
MNRFFKHTVLKHIIEVESEYRFKFPSDWLIVSEDTTAYIGTIVYDPLITFGVGYHSDSWVAHTFRELIEGFSLYIDYEDEMFEVFVCEDKKVYTGGWFKSEVEWDSEEKPRALVRIKIESEINSRIKSSE